MLPEREALVVLSDWKGHLFCAEIIEGYGSMPIEHEKRYEKQALLRFFREIGRSSVLCPPPMFLEFRGGHPDMFTEGGIEGGLGIEPCIKGDPKNR